MTGKPTPTQAEADAHARGEHVEEHEPDGSPIQYGAMPQGLLDEVEKKAVVVEEPKPVVVPIESSVVTEATVVKVAEAEPEKASYKTRSSKPSEK